MGDGDGQAGGATARDVTALKRKIVRLIEMAGPMSVADYMALCLFDPDHGYYTTREPFGAEGDFTTAPEISQMFGELIAVWVYSAWAALDRPLPVTLAEIGPGRGTLMKDMLRTWSALDPKLLDAADLALIEASPRLTEVQKATLRDAPAQPVWMSSVGELPEQPLILVGNELFDALPIRQFVRTEGGWNERAIGLDDRGELAFISGAGGIDPAVLPAGAAAAPAGAVFETSPAREALMEEIAARLARNGGAALFIDYGHRTSGFGDTLQAVRRHAFDPVLGHPGEADLTAHVDFEALARIARAYGLQTGLVTQGKFLLAMGLLERAGRLGADRGQEARERISGEVERLAGADGMGKLFKMLAVFPESIRVAPFFQAD
jgi:SAM-dependent MidA family methyltransferase